MVLDVSSRKRKRPEPVPLVAGKRAKGAVTVVEHSTKVSAKTRAFDDFSDPLLPDWVPVHGKLTTTGGASPDVAAWVTTDYAAAYHRTQMLSDNMRVKVVIQDGTIQSGKARAFLCADKLLNRYYGIEIDNGSGSSDHMSIVKGFGANSVKTFDTVDIAITAGDEFEVWFDRNNSVIRGYQNGVEQCSLEVPAYEIQHGPGHRYCGVTMGASWFLAPGPDFTSFEAWDVTQPGPWLRDTMDGPDIESFWTPVLNDAEIHRHLLAPQTMGPDVHFWNDAAVVSSTSASQDSVRVVFSALRDGPGKYTVALCANSTLTSWIGVQFQVGLANKARIVTGTGPTTYTERASKDWTIVQQKRVYTVTYDHTTKTVSVFKNAKRTPFLSWTDSTNIATHGSSNRRVGQIWETSLFNPGVEPSSFEAYNVNSDLPL